MKVRVPVLGTVGKTVTIDTTVPARLAVIEQQITTLNAPATRQVAHSALSGLQTGDDHPQYTMWQAREVITGEWTFETLPIIEDSLLPEFIEDTIGAILADTSSVLLNYGDTAGQITAQIVDEYVEDLVGSMLIDSQTVNFTYFDYTGTLGRIEAEVIPGGIIHGMLAGLSADDHPQYPLAAGTETISGTWTFDVGTDNNFRFSERGGVAELIALNDAAAAPVAMRIFATSIDLTDSSGTGLLQIGIGGAFIRIPRDNEELQIGAGQDLRLFHDGTNSHIHNDTGDLRLTVNGNFALYEAGPTTGTATAAMASTNKPGANNKTQPDTWLPVDLDGTLYYVPCYLP